MDNVYALLFINGITFMDWIFVNENSIPSYLLAIAWVCNVFQGNAGYFYKGGNIIIAQIVKKQIAQDAWDEALSRIQPIKFEDWWKKYKDTISE